MCNRAAAAAWSIVPGQNRSATMARLALRSPVRRSGPGRFPGPPRPSQGLSRSFPGRGPSLVSTSGLKGPLAATLEAKVGLHRRAATKLTPPPVKTQSGAARENGFQSLNRKAGAIPAPSKRANHDFNSPGSVRSSHKPTIRSSFARPEGDFNGLSRSAFMHRRIALITAQVRGIRSRCTRGMFCLVEGIKLFRELYNRGPGVSERTEAFFCAQLCRWASSPLSMKQHQPAKMMARHENTLDAPGCNLAFARFAQGQL